MSGEFERKATVVATAWEMLDGNPEWEAVLKANDLGFPFAYLVHQNMGTLNSQAKKYVEATYDFILNALELEDSDEFTSFAAVLIAHPANSEV